MRLALLVGADPKTCTHGPRVRVLAGKWRLDVHGIEDSILIMHVEGDNKMELEVLNGIHFICNENEKVQVQFSKRGKEKYVSVIAEKVA